MKKVINNLINYIKDDYIEKFSLSLLLLWVISPIVEYIFNNYYKGFYTYYFNFIGRFIGLFGIVIYIVYLIKLKKKKGINIKKFIPEILIIILLIIAIISSFLSKNVYLSFFGESYRKEGLIVYIMYIGFILLASIIRNSKYLKYLFKCMLVFALIVAILPLLKSNFTYMGFANIFHNPNHYGYYLMINVMISAFMFIDNKNWFKKIIYLIIYIFFTYLLIRNDTFGSYLAITVSLLFMFIYAFVKKYQRLNIVIVIIVFIFTSFTVSHYDIKIGEKVHFESTKGIIVRNFLFLFDDTRSIIKRDEDGINKAGTGRGLLWKEAINYTLNHPLLGGGMECLKIYYLDNNILIDRPHNMILQTSSFIGIPGAIIYVILILYITIANLKIMKHDTVYIMICFTTIAYFISSMFGNSMYYTSPYFMILLGLLIGFNRNKKEQIRLTK